MVTTTEIAEIVQNFVDLAVTREELFYDWITGAADGGPSGDGVYPIKSWDSVEHMVPAVAKLEEMLDQTAGLSQAATDALAAGTISLLIGDRIYSSRALLDADLAHDAGLYAMVVGDPVAANNDLYKKTGASGAGSWGEPVGFFAAASALAAAERQLAEDARNKSKQWAEGTEPDGPGTKSAKEWAEEAAVTAADVAGRIALHPGKKALDVFKDKKGRVYRYTQQDGGERMVGLADTVQNEINALKSGNVTKIARAFATYVVPVLAAVAAMHGFGQSNGAGANGQMALTAAKPSGLKAITYNGGPKANPTNSAVTMTSLKDLVEDNLSGDSDINAGSVRGETPISSACYGFWSSYLRERGPDAAAALTMFGHTSAVGGQSIGPLSTTHYPRFLTSVQKARDLVVASGKTYCVASILYDGNEANQGNATVAAYRSAMRTLYNTMVTDVRGITGQTFDPIWIMPQKSWSMQTGTYPASVTLAQFAEQGSGMFVSHPDYCTFIAATSDDIHRANVGHALSGHYHARCARNVLIRGQDWRGLMLRSCWWQNGKGYAKFDVPVQPLVLDSDTLGAATQHGFKLTDATGDLPVTVKVVSGDTVEFTPGRARNGGVNLRVGMDVLPAKCTLVVGSGGTTLRDSDTETVRINGTDYLTANWALSTTLDFILLEV